MAWETPKISIGGIDINSQGFAWALTAGVTPYMTTFTVTDLEINNNLLNLTNPTSITLSLTGGVNGRPEPFITQFDNIYILEPKRIDPFHTLWTIADARWAWRGRKIYGSWNKTRIKNEKGISINVSDTDPQILKQQMDTFAVGRYLPWSLRGGEATYTVYEILVEVLADLGIAYTHNSTGQRGAYTLENVDLNGEDIYTGLSYLLSLSRLNMGINRFGSVYVFSLDWFDTSELNLKQAFANCLRTKPGVFWQQDLRKIRPSKINVRFEKKKEVWVIGTEATVQDRPEHFPQANSNLLYSNLRTQWDIDNWLAISCVNVMQVPYPIKINNIDVNTGEWVSVRSYLDAIGLTESDLRTYYFAGILERKYANYMETVKGVTPSAMNEVYAQHVIAAIKAHYRTTWKIDPYYCDHMESWEPRRVSVINNYDHFSPSSPVFQDCCFMPYVRHPAVAKRTATWNTDSYNWRPNVDDLQRKKPIGATISIVSQEFGIFSVSMPGGGQNFLYGVARVFPFALDPLPYRSLSGSTYKLEQCHPMEKHVFETILSVKWATGRDRKYNSSTKYYQIPFVYGGQGPEIDFLSGLEDARYCVKSYKGDDPPILEGDPTQPVNDKILGALASVEAAKLYNQYRDRYVGFVTFAGFVDTNLAGTIKSINYSFSPHAGLETMVDAREIPPSPTIEQSLDQDSIDYLRKHVSKGSNKAELKP